MATDPFANLTKEQLAGLKAAGDYFGAKGYKGRLQRETSTKRIVDFKKAETKKLIAASKMAESVKKRTPAQTSSPKPKLKSKSSNPGSPLSAAQRELKSRTTRPGRGAR